MKYSLPFGLKQKPLNHYFEHGVIKFNVNEGTLHYTIKLINRTISGILLQGEVKSKEHLDKLLKIKSIHNIQALEVVNQ